MNIDIAKDDLIPLRRELAELYDRMETYPVMLSLDPEWKRMQDSVREDMAIIAKTIRKLSQACKKAYGHDCCGYLYARPTGCE